MSEAVALTPLPLPPGPITGPQAWYGRDMAARHDWLVQFTPHLLPMNRGILATTYVKGDPATVHATLAAAYAGEPFLRVLPFGALPSTRDIAGSNFCHIGVIGDRIPNRAVVVAHLHGPQAGLDAISRIADRDRLESHYLLHAVTGAADGEGASGPGHTHLQPQVVTS